jgi:hypothetical protein
LGFWKLEKANYEVMQQNLTMDYMQILLRHREEIKELFGRHEDIVQSLQEDMQAIVAPIVPIAPTEAAEEDKEEVVELSILGIPKQGLNEQPRDTFFIEFFFILLRMG